MKDPRAEQVNMNFLCMLSSPKWIERLETAYKDYYGRVWKPGKYQSIAYEWLKGFIANCDFSVDSSSGIMKELASSQGMTIALVGYSKLRKLSEDEREKIGVFGIQNEMEGFSGFAFGTYPSVIHDSQCPYACALFIDYLLSEEGFAGDGAWNEYCGYYSTNKMIEKEVEGDFSFGFWEDKLVVEEPGYINSGQNEAIQNFIESCLAGR